MAKSTKSSSAAKPAASAKSAKAEKAKAPKPDAAQPQIDPAQSAAAAAAMIAQGLTAPAPVSDAPKTESTSFRNLKQSLNKPHSQTMGNLLDKLAPPGQKKSSLPFGGGKQVGHNQTFGSDASRRNVPRRTGG